MKIYIIMHKGAKIARNLGFEEKITFVETKEKIWAGRYFWRKKDAKKYLEAEYSEMVGKYRQIVSAEVK